MSIEVFIMGTAREHEEGAGGEWVDPSSLTIPDSVDLPGVGRATIVRWEDERGDIRIKAVVDFDGETTPLHEFQERIVDPVRQAIGAR